MKNVLIFGSTGNVGSYLTLYAKNFFKNEDYNIIAIGRRKTDFFSKYGIQYYSVDMTKKEDFKQLPTQNNYAVIFLSATIPSYMSSYDPVKYVETNTLGAINVLEFCRKTKVDRILYSQTVFDISESVRNGVCIDPYTPRNFNFKGDHAVYVVSKNAAVDLIEHYHQEYALKKFIFRFPTIYNYSPFHYYYPNGKKTKRPIYTMIENAIQSKPIEIWGDKNYSKDMVYVADCSQMFCKALTVNRESGFYNVGTGIPITIEEQVKTIRNVFSPKNNPSPIIYRPEKAVGGGFLMDITNAKKELGYEPQYNCEKLFQAYKEEMKLNRFAELLNK